MGVCYARGRASIFFIYFVTFSGENIIGSAYFFYYLVNLWQLPGALAIKTNKINSLSGWF